MVFIRSRMISLFAKIKAMNKTYKMLALTALGAFVIVGSMMAGGIGFSYDVIYNGEKVGRISDLTVYSEAKTLAKSSVVHTKDSDLSLAAPKLHFNFSFEAPTTTAKELSAEIIKNSADVISGYSVKIGDKAGFYIGDKSLVNNIINDYCSSFNVEGLDCESKLTAAVTFNEVFIDDSVIASKDEIRNLVDGLEVTTVANKVTTYNVPYETKTTRTSKKNTGYVAVTTAGVKGVNEKTEKVTFVNGVQVSSEIISDQVISAPVTEVVVVGTGKSSYSSVAHNASTKGFVWPLEVKGVITSYWGDGRGHKGLDIAARAGTEIHAVKAGTVTFAGWNNDYGYNVIIDHGNGVKTRYAHSRKLHVKAGQTVSQGQFIAEVGTTGQSTGNHCHFEVIINGTRVNPAPYLGI